MSNGSAPDGSAPLSGRLPVARGGPAVASEHPRAPTSDLSVIAAAVADAGACAFVHVGNRFDDDLRYLTRFGGPDREYALVVVPDRAVLCAPALFEEQAHAEFVAPADDLPREVRTENLGDPAGRRAAVVVADLTDGDPATTDADSTTDGDPTTDDAQNPTTDTLEPTLLVPLHLPHDAAVYIEQAGYSLSSTTVVADARRVKTEAEIACLRRVQAVTCRGMARAEAVLATATVDGDALVWDGAPLTTERLRREVNTELARHGVRDAGNTVVGSGPSAADLHFTGHDAVGSGETVLLDVSPRGPHGHYGDLTRTFVVESDGGWERRAYVAVEAAHELALETVAAGVPAATVHEEAAAELAAYGFRVDSSAVGFTHGVGHGVGVSLHEEPSLRAADPLEAGQVVTVEPGVYDPGRGGVRIEDTVVVTEDGCEKLADYPVRFVPEPSTGTDD